MSLDYHNVAALAKTWPVLVVFAAIVTFILGALSSNGYIDPVVHKSEISIINSKVIDIEHTLEENKSDHRSMQQDARAIMSTLARIEGRLSTHP